VPRLPKRLELEKQKAKLAQLRMENASKPQFKSISEFLASLERCDSSNSNEGDAFFLAGNRSRSSLLRLFRLELFYTRNVNMASHSSISSFEYIEPHLFHLLDPDQRSLIVMNIDPDSQHC